MPTVDRESRNPRSGLRFRSLRKALSEVPRVRRPMTARAPVTDAICASPDQVSAFRLSRHHLVQRAPASALAQVAGDMAGAPAPGVLPAQKFFFGPSPRPPHGGREKARWRWPGRPETVGVLPAPPPLPP